MRAAVWHNQRDVRIEDVQSPPPPPRGQVQVKVSWCGICGTDLHEYLGGPIYIPVGHPHPLTGVQAPVIIGHEMSGRSVWMWGPGCSRLCSGRSGGRLSHHRVRNVPLVPLRFDGAVRSCSLPGDFLDRWRARRAVEPPCLPVLSLAAVYIRRRRRTGRAVLGGGPRHRSQRPQSRGACRRRGCRALMGLDDHYGDAHLWLCARGRF